MFERRLLKPINIFLLAMDTIRWELKSLEDYMVESTQNLERRQQDLEQEYEKAKATYDEDDAGMEFHFEDQFDRYHNNYPVFIYNSLLVNQFSFFELHLRHLCEMYEVRSFSRVKLSDLNGTDIDKCRKFLTLIADLNFTEIEHDWQKIRFFQKLRNVVVHHGNKIPNGSSYDNLINHIKVEKRITLNEPSHEFLVNDIALLMEFNQVILGCFESITNRLSKTSVIAKNFHMPYNNQAWGQEKSYNALESLANILETLHFEQINETPVPNKLVTSLEFNLGTIAYDLTKLYAFFCNAEWEPKDRDSIMMERLKGLEKVVEIYESR